MNITLRIKQIMHSKNITVTQLNEMINKKNGTDYSVQNLSRKLSKDDIKFSDAIDILDILGYKIDIVEKDPVPNELFTNKNFIPETSKQLTMIDLENEDKIIEDYFEKEIDSIIKNEVEKQLKQMVKEQTQSYIKKVFISKAYDSTDNFKVKSIYRDNNIDNKQK